jgi:cysteine desulfurase
VPGIVGFGKAAELALKLMPAEAPRLRALARRLLDALLQAADGIELNGHPERRLPHNVNVFVEGVEAKSLVLALPELAFSTGAACSTAHVEPSHVIQALGLGPERAHCTIRLGLGRSTSPDEVDFAADRLAHAVSQNRLMRPGPAATKR